MSVYVDNMAAPLGNMIMCHMWADTIDELLTMVDKIGVQRKWIQGHPVLSLDEYRNVSWVHFDISRSKRTLAIKNGAIETDRYGPLQYIANLYITSAEPDCIAMGKRRLSQIDAHRKNKLDYPGELQLRFDLF